MRTFIKLIYFSLILISCQEEDIQISDTGRKIVINGLITTDSLINVNLSQSIYITDAFNVEEKLLNEATAYISESSSRIDTLQYNFDGYINLGVDIYVPSNFWSKKVFPKAGHEYKIEVKSGNLPLATSTTLIPNLVKIEKVDTTLIILPGTFEEWESNVRLRCDIEFIDPINEKNYYLLYIYKVPNYNIEANNIAFLCQDPVVEEKLEHGTIMEGVAFSDKSINGQKYRLQITLDGRELGMPFYDDTNLYLYPSEYHHKAIYFRLYSITEEYFKYIQTLNLFYKNFNNPLAEPTQVYSNVEGGYGIFAGAAVSSDSLVFTF